MNSQALRANGLLTNIEKNVKMLMNKELQQYYDSLFDLFASDGWKRLLEQLKATKEGLNEIRSIPSGDDLFFKKGQLDVIDTLLAYPALTEQAYKAAQEAGEE